MSSRQRLALALALPFLACGVQWLLWDATIQPYVWFLFFPAVFGSAWLGGFTGGIGGALIGAALVWAVFMAPPLSFGFKGVASIASISIFVAMGALYAWIFARLGRAQQRSDEALRAAERANQQMATLYRKTLELDELKSQFFAHVSHELRTPLTQIIAPLERRLREDDLAPEARAEIDAMLQSARALYRQVSDLLDIARLEGGGIAMDYGPVDFAALARSRASRFDVAARARGIDFRVDTPPELSIEADREKLQRMLLNLLSAAFERTPDGGSIALRLASVGDTALLTLQDGGAGLPPGMATADGASVDRRHGEVGSGLAIVREFAALHGGLVSASEAPGGGALLTLRLPLRAPAGTPVPARAPLAEAGTDEAVDGLTVPPIVSAEAPADAPLVLLVEDNAEISDFIAAALRPHYRLASAADGNEALELAAGLLPDLILADATMPAMHGDALVTALRARPELAEVPIVVLTARADDALRVRLLQRGVQDCLVRPFAVAELLARVAGLIRVRRAAGERLRASERRFEATFEHAAVGIALVAPDGRWQRVNRWLCAILGYSQDELLARTFQDITHPSDIGTDLELVRRLLGGEIGTYTIEKRYFRKDGSVVWVNLSVALIRRPDGEPDHFVSVIEDISARKADEAALREQGQMLADMSAMAHIGGWSFDPSTGQGSWTPECARIHDLPEDAQIDVGRGLSYYRDDQRPLIEAAVRAACERGLPYDLELEITSALGRRKWIRTIGHPLMEHGRVVRVFGAFQDITDSKRVEAELKRRNEELERFNRAAEDRELRMVALKREVNALAAELRRTPPYDLSFADDFPPETSP